MRTTYEGCSKPPIHGFSEVDRYEINTSDHFYDKSCEQLLLFKDFFVFNMCRFQNVRRNLTKGGSTLPPTK